MSSAAAAAAVVDYLNERQFTHKFHAERLAFPRTKLTEAHGLQVTVFNGPRILEAFGRGIWKATYTVYVVLQKKLPATAREAIGEADKLTAVAEQIETYLHEDGEMGIYAFSAYDETNEKLPFDMETLRESGVFTAVVGLEVLKVG